MTYAPLTDSLSDSNPLLPRPTSMYPIQEAAGERPEKIKTIAAKILFVLGIALLLLSSSLFLGHLLHFTVIEVPIVQALFYCGLAAMLAGCSQKNYKGSVNLIPPGFPFALRLDF